MRGSLKVKRSIVNRMSVGSIPTRAAKNVLESICHVGISLLNLQPKHDIYRTAWQAANPSPLPRHD